MQVPPPQACAYEATAMLVGPVNVLFDGVVQSTWNFQNASEVVVFSPTTKFGEPDGGSVALSRFEGKRPPKLLLVVKHCWVAAVPFSMLARSKAQSSAPRNVVPDALKRL